MYESKLGKQLDIFKARTWHKVIGIMCILLVIFFLFMGTTALIFPDVYGFDFDNNPHDRIEWSVLVPLMFIMTIPVAMFAGHWLRIRTVVLYENGIAILKGQDPIHELTYTEIKGLLIMSMRTHLISHGPSPNTVTFGKISSSLTILRHDDPELITVSVSRLKKLAKALNPAFTQHIVKGINRDNIHQASLYFGEHLRLESGVFYHESPQGNIQIPYKNITHLQFTTQRFKFMALLGGNQLIEISYKQADSLFNLDVLYYILKIMPGAIL